MSKRMSKRRAEHSHNSSMVAVRTMIAIGAVYVAATSAARPVDVDVFVPPHRGFPPSLSPGCLRRDKQKDLWCPGDKEYGCYKV